MNELSARQLACKAIHEDKANVNNPSIMAKYMDEYANSKLKRAIKEIKELEKLETLENPIFLREAITIIKKEIAKT